MNIHELAAHAIEALKPALPFMGQQVASGFARQPGAKLYDWLAARFKGTEREATLEQAIKEPENERQIDLLQAEIVGLLRNNSTAVQELQGLLSEIGAVSGTQTAHVIGDDARITQTIGNFNKTGH